MDDLNALNNDRFIRYYRAQGIYNDEWLKYLQSTLPSTFRVCSSRDAADSLVRTIQSSKVEGLQAIDWYPHLPTGQPLAYSLPVPKKVLRTDPAIKEFHAWLVFESEVGNISRQELVSMIPPILLDVRPHHRVMDMCAAPGSKTAQLLEALHIDGEASGLVLANDSDLKRTHLLIHQSARLPSPNFIVTNLDASAYPTIKIPNALGRPTPLRFDRILADVPCSGDGTLRKNVGIWKKWGVGDGNGLHSLQLRILLRGIEMLEQNGRLVYSTCSMNPIENEAVVAQALRAHPEFRLIDVSHLLPSLKRSPGLSNWITTTDREVQVTYDSYDKWTKDHSGEVGGGGKKPKLFRSHFPPTSEESGWMNLHRCLRIYAHLQDTGGFFVAVLERSRAEATQEGERQKKRPATPSVDDPSKKPRVEDSESILEHTDIDSSTPSAGTPQSTPNPAPIFKENPYTYLDPQNQVDKKILDGVRACLNLIPSFPFDSLLVRAEALPSNKKAKGLEPGPSAPPVAAVARTLYLSTPLLRQILTSNSYEKFRVTSAGARVIVRQDGPSGKNQGPEDDKDAHFRPLAESLPILLPYIHTESIIPCPAAALRQLVKEYYPLCKDFLDIKDVNEDAGEGFGQKLVDCSPGSHVIRVAPSTTGAVSLSHPLTLPIWKSNVSVTLMIDKRGKSALSLRLFGEDITTAGRDARERSEREKNERANSKGTDTSGRIDARDKPSASGSKQDVKVDTWAQQNTEKAQKRNQRRGKKGRGRRRDKGDSGERRGDVVVVGEMEQYEE